MMKLTIKARLTLSFALLVLALAGLGLYAVISLNTVNNQSTVINKQWLPGVDGAHRMNTMSSDYRISELRRILADTPEEEKELDERIRNTGAAFQQELREYGEIIQSDRGKKLLEPIEDEWSNYAKISDELLRLGREHRTEEMQELLKGASKQSFDKLSASLLELVEYNQENVKLADEQSNAVYSRTVAILITVIVLVTAVAIALGVLITRSIIRPIENLSEAADRLALGDVNVNVDTASRDEIGLLLQAFGRMIASIREQALVVERIAGGDLTVQIHVRSDKDLLGLKLQEMIERNHEIMTRISMAADQVATGSKQVSDSGIALSQGATEQASSVEQLTASLEEISSQTKLNAQNANEANELSGASRTNAMQGNEQMKGMLKAMQEINEASSSISKIIKVIDEIAFQTNILALNAAVEAARAGQHGKGFAVVAEEVRNLAARSANAAKETTAMIEGSILKVQDGTRIADRTAEALQAIVADIDKVANLVNDIAMASTEQAAAITQINQGISQVSQVIQTNSATSEESAAASEELSGQANLLKQQVSRFKLHAAKSGPSGFDEMNPGVLRMLDTLHAQPKEAAAAGAPRIALSDSEFGKY